MTGKLFQRQTNVGAPALWPASSLSAIYMPSRRISFA
jgi:hypothetical protein